MKQFLPGYVLLLIGLLVMIFISCEQTLAPANEGEDKSIMQIDSEYISFNSLINLVPDSSDTPFDFFAIRGRPNPKELQQGVLSLLKDPLSDKKLYYNYPIKMGLPPGLTGRGNQPISTIHVTIKNSSNQVLLQYQGEITNNPAAKRMVRNWINNVLNSIQENRLNEITNENPLIINAIGECPKIELSDYDSCRTEGDFETGFELVCDIEECSSGPSGWSPPEPEEDPSDNNFPDPCDDPEFDCSTGSNGGSNDDDDPDRDGGDNKECGRLDDDCYENPLDDRDPIPEPCETNLEQLQQTFPNTQTDILEDLTSLINSYASDFGIDSDEKMQHFLSQAGHESSNFAGVPFSAFTENLNYRVNQLGVEYWHNYFNPISDPTLDPNKANPLEFAQYPGSTFVDHEKFANYVYSDQYRTFKLGNTNPGDGYKFRGRGIIQLTGRDNYERFNTFYQNNYDSTVDLISNPDLLSNNTEIAVISALWFFENNVLNIGNINENTSVAEVTKKVNGKYNGLDHRKNLFNSTSTHINCL